MGRRLEEYERWENQLAAIAWGTGTTTPAPMVKPSGLRAPVLLIVDVIAAIAIRLALIAVAIRFVHSCD